MKRSRVTCHTAIAAAAACTSVGMVSFVWLQREASRVAFGAVVGGFCAAATTTDAAATTVDTPVAAATVPAEYGR